MHHTNIHATQPQASAANEHDATGSFAVWIVLYAVLMVAAMTFFAGANVLGDRFDRIAPVASIAQR